jgi:hypothetical protein
VKAELDPIPLRAGKSPSWCTSMPRFGFMNCSTALTAGWVMSSTVRVISIFEYTTRKRCSKNGGKYRQVR